MESPASINKGNPVYISFAPNSDEPPEYAHIADCVERLKEAFDDNNIEYRITDTPDSDIEISNFDKEIGWQSQVVVLVFSDRYFRSFHCMHQFAQIKKALKKHPEKRLFCIKSGNFNLSDINYILDLEHYWGDQKQDYEESEYFKTREHTGVEKAAHENDFYMNDVRSLYSFFSTLNYAYATQDDWGGFVKEIVNSFTVPSKYALTVKEKKKARNKQLQFMGIGCAICMLMPFLIFFGHLGLESLYNNNRVAYNPQYSKGLDNMEISKITWMTNESVALYIRLANPNDRDTMIYASRSCHLIYDDDRYQLDSASGIATYPDYDILTAHDTVSFTLYFEELYEDPDSIDLVLKPGVGIYGIILNDENEEE